MTLSDKVAHSKALIAEHLSRATQPICLWSSGKDSQVLLWLIRQVQPEFQTCLFFQENIKQPRKFEFATRMIREWDLVVYNYRASGTDCLAKDGAIEIINKYDVGGQAYIYLPLGIADPYDPSEFECGIEIIAKPLIPAFAYPWDLTFIGHKASDSDPIHGKIQVGDDTAKLGTTTVVYPLRDWTDEDIWQAIRQFNIPYETRRYDVENNFAEFVDQRWNPDYYSVCTECLKPGLDVKEVYCPKLNEPVTYLGHLTASADKISHYRSTFINLTGSQNVNIERLSDHEVESSQTQSE